MASGEDRHGDEDHSNYQAVQGRNEGVIGKD
jgi:hypothetical protein